MKPERGRWFVVGLFATALATLALETLDTRLLSVLTWYHLSFLAVSLAMLGMAAAAIQVYLNAERYHGDKARDALASDAARFALSVPLCYLLNISIPIPDEIDTNAVVSLGLSCLSLGVPFYFSGLVVSGALTRIPGRVGIVYAVDLVGAALGSLLVLVLLSYGTMSTAILVSAAIAAIGALCFRHFAGRKVGLWALAPAILAVLSVLNTTSDDRVRIVYSKGTTQATKNVWREKWSIHGQVNMMRPGKGSPWYWGAGRGALQSGVESAFLFIDGSAGTSMTHWDGRPKSIAWTQYDLTALVYHLRPEGRVGIVGVGGGRDVLTAIWSRATSITGVEINHAFVDLLKHDAIDFARIAKYPRVRIVHDEGRSYMTRTNEQFDVLQMSLIDTWAATGAGAFTLSENGLYTLEAWDVFLNRLSPRGIFSVSRWFSAGNASETSRLLSLATASLIRRGVAEPERHLALITLSNIATLLVSAAPFDDADLTTLRETTDRLGFRILLAPGQSPGDALLGAIASSHTRGDLDRAVAGRPYDFSPPTDDRPYFFNLLRVNDISGLFKEVPGGGVVTGNLRATKTLAILLVLVFLAVVTVILVPVARSGLPEMALSTFAASISYFGLIGTGFMLVQIGLMQRLSVYLGHPTYAVAITLFSMIAAAGAGSFLSERIPAAATTRAVPRLALGTSLIIAVATFALQPLIDGTIRRDLPTRGLLTVALVVPVSLALGLFFPLGMRLVRRVGSNGEPWMWGVNGACGVLASVVGVIVSIGAGIRVTLLVGAAAYALLAVPAVLLGRARPKAESETEPAPADAGSSAVA